MPLVPIPVPPGVIKPATPLQAKGRYWDSNLVRWQSNKLLPVGGWQRINSTPLDSQIRTIFSWATNDGLKLSLVGCNDDGAGGTCYMTGTATPYASALSISVNVGHWYLVRNGSFTSGDTGNGSLTFTLPAPCALPAPTSSESEACGAATNQGCNDAGGGNPTEPISLGSTIGGTGLAISAASASGVVVLTVSAGSLCSALSWPV